MGAWFSSVFQNMFGFLLEWFKWIGNFVVNGIGGFFTKLFSVIKNVGSAIVNGIVDGVVSAVNFVVDVINKIATWFMNGITSLFEPLIKFFDGLFYFITQALMVIVWVLKLILGLIGVVFSVIGGFFNTIFSFVTWSGSATQVHSAYNDGFMFFLDAFNQVGGSVFAGVFAVFIWLMTIMIIFKIVKD